MSKEEYNNLPVAACKHCRSLHIVTDDEENEHCMSCGAKNEIVIYSTIEDYFRENHQIKEQL
jgi:hypothetical protein